MEFTGERYMPIETINPQLALEHWHRYLWANNFVKDKIVLDIACGEGFGSNFLAKNAKFVTGADISTESVLHAKNNYNGNNLEFKVMSVDGIEFEDNSIDVVVSFETIEHIDGESQEKAIEEFSRILKEDGLLCITTPGIESPRHCKHNEFHIKECSYDEFGSLLNKRFKYIRIFGQSVYNTSVIGDAEDEVDILNKSFNKYDQTYEHNVKEDKYLMAICSNKPLDDLKINSILVDRAFMPIKNIINISSKRTQTSLIKVFTTLVKIFVYTILEKLSIGEKADKYFQKKVKYITRI